MKIQVWESKNGKITALGSHDPEALVKAIETYYIDEVGLTLEEEEKIHLSNIKELWVDPVVFTIDFGERIPNMFLSNVHRTAWVPMVTADIREP